MMMTQPNPLAALNPFDPQNIKMLMGENSPLGKVGRQLVSKMNMGMALTSIFSDAQLKFIRENFEQKNKRAVAQALFDAQDALKKQGYDAEALYMKLCEYYDIEP